MKTDIITEAVKFPNLRELLGGMAAIDMDA